MDQEGEYANHLINNPMIQNEQKIEKVGICQELNEVCANLKTTSLNSNSDEISTNSNKAMKCLGYLNTAPCTDSSLSVNTSVNLINYDITKNADTEKKLGDYLCEAIFISGLSSKEAQLIKNSESYTSPCSHNDCAILPAYRPDILCRFPKHDLDYLSLSNSVNFNLN